MGGVPIFTAFSMTLTVGAKKNRKKKKRNPWMSEQCQAQYSEIFSWKMEKKKKH